MLLLEKQLTFTNSASKTNLFLPFTVPEGLTALRVSFSYFPKTVEDEAQALAQITEARKKYNAVIPHPETDLPVQNLITLSFDAPDGYRGACHRQPNEQIIYIGENATPGILPGAALPGEWRAALNLHYVGCEVRCRLTVEGVTL